MKRPGFQPQPAVQCIDTIVIGAGHAGLAVSNRLANLEVDHIILERGDVGERWRHERWDSLHLLTPNWMFALPDFGYAGKEPNGYLHKDEVARLIVRYAIQSNAPVFTNTEVTGVVPHNGGYLVTSNRAQLWCRALVVATGAFAKPVLPALAASIPTSIHQLSSADYRNPDQLQPGSVLVVGASATGIQLSQEIQRSGRQVTLAVGEHVRMPRTYRGRDVYWWLQRSGVLDEDLNEVDDLQRARRLPSPQLIGRRNKEMGLNELQAAGVELVGRLAGSRGSKLQFSGGLANLCRLADLKQSRLLNRFDEWAHLNGLPGDGERGEPTNIRSPRLELDTSEIHSIVWATGFAPDYNWLDLPVFNKQGVLQHQAGRICLPGLYVTGLPLLRSRKSSFVYGATDDANSICQQLKAYLDSTAGASLVL